jgi:prepilin-type N-terminal cleavage/methylation domain-containing protein
MFRKCDSGNRFSAFICPAVRAQRFACAGYTLIEALVVLTIMGVLMSMSAPSFYRALEQTKVDIAGANLQAIWSAERLYWLNQHVYAPDLQTLVSAGLLDPSLLPPNPVDSSSMTPAYFYTISASSDLSSFSATAQRNPNASWSGTLAIDQTGTFSGSLHAAGQSPITPTFQ